MDETKKIQTFFVPCTECKNSQNLVSLKERGRLLCLSCSHLFLSDRFVLFPFQFRNLMTNELRFTNQSKNQREKTEKQQINAC